MAGLQLQNLKKSFGSVAVIQGVSIEIGDGEFVVLVGPSGCGKSTLLRMIAGLEPVSSGEIRIDGRLVNDVSPMDRDIAMVFQNYALYPHMNVTENMGFSLMLRGVPKQQIRERVGKAAEILGLQALLKRYPRELSGGQRQRVAMGRAIVRDPQVFLFDEPLSNLDAKLRFQMRAEIKELHQRLKSTVVYVTHDQVEGMSLADKIVVMHEGMVRQVGAPLEVYDRPADTFVAGFIGSPGMNFLAGTISPDAAGVVTDDGLMLPLAVPASGNEGRAVLYGIRPEHLEIDTEHGVPATIHVVEPTGSETHVVAGIGHQTITVTFHRRVDLQRGQQVLLAPARGLSHLFDGETGRRLN